MTIAVAFFRTHVISWRPSPPVVVRGSLVMNHAQMTNGLSWAMESKIVEAVSPAQLAEGFEQLGVTSLRKIRRLFDEHCAHCELDAIILRNILGRLTETAPLLDVTYPG
jgi:hypothetical protein